MPRPSKYNAGGERKNLPVGLHLLKINIDPELPEMLRLGIKDASGGKNAQLTITSFNRDGSTTDFIPIMESTMFRIQYYIAALMGRQWKDKQSQEDNPNKFIYDELLTKDPRTGLMSQWEIMLNQFDYLDTDSGRQTFITWIRRMAGRPFWATLREAKNRDGSIKQYPEIVVFPPHNIHACDDSEAGSWLAPEAEEKSAVEVDVSGIGL